MKKYVIPYKGLTVGRHNFEFEIHDAFFKQFEASEILGGDLSVSIELQKGTNVMTLDLTIEGNVRVECDRCLEECELGMDFEDKLVVRVSETEDQYDGEVMWISPMQGEVDLTQYLYESIILSLPYQKVHGEDQNGKPLCNPEMLEKFKIVSEQEFIQFVAQKEQSQGRDTQWAKLKELKDKIK